MADSASANDATPPAAARRRWLPRFRFSLATLTIATLLAGSGMGLWFRWEPWVRTQQFPAGTMCPELSQNGALAAIHTDDGTVKLLDLTTGKVQSELRVAERRIFRVWFSPDASQAIGELECARARVWNTKDATEKADLEDVTPENCFFA